MSVDSQKLSERTWLNDLAEAELNGLKRDGIEPTWNQVVMIHELAKKVENPNLKKIGLTGTPIRLNNRTLYPFTIQGAEWYTFVAEQIPEDLCLVALVYAYEHGRDKDAFVELYDVDNVVKTLKAYQKRFDFNAEELSFVLALMQAGHDDHSGDDNGATSFDDVVGFLTAETGIDPEFWRCRASIDYAVNQMGIINSRNAEEVEHHKTTYIKAEQNLGKALMEIRNG